MFRNLGLLLCSLALGLGCIGIVTPAAHADYGTVTIDYSSETMEAINDYDVCHFEDSITMTYELTGNTIALDYAEYKPSPYHDWEEMETASIAFTTDYGIVHDALLKLVYVDDTTILVASSFITYYNDGDGPVNPYGANKYTCWWMHEETWEKHYVDYYYPPQHCPCRGLGIKWKCPAGGG